MISRIYSFFKEVVSSKPTVFIIDNAHYLDDFSLELLEYVQMKGNSDKNIMIILSYSDGEYSRNLRFFQFINKNMSFEKIYIGALNNEETGVMIQKMLSMPRPSDEFAPRVYSRTYGNPLFIQETIKELLSKKTIYINENSGTWYASIDNFEEMPIASTMEQALLNQIREIDKESYEVLKIISIFNNAVSIEVIEKLSCYT